MPEVAGASTSSRAKAFAVVALVGAGAGLAVAWFSQQRQRKVSEVKEEEAVVFVEPSLDAAEPPPVEEAVEVLVEKGGCARNEGPMAGWQTKVHTAHLAVEEAILALRGRGTIQTQLRELREALGTAETLLNDSVYCTGKEERLNHLVGELSPLFTSDASSLLLHPIKGEALREHLLEELQAWDDA